MPADAVPVLPGRIRRTVVVDGVEYVVEFARRFGSFGTLPCPKGHPTMTLQVVEVIGCIVKDGSHLPTGDEYRELKPRLHAQLQNDLDALAVCEDPGCVS